jgi:ABC-type transporter Mla MlaB component
VEAWSSRPPAGTAQVRAARPATAVLALPRRIEADDLPGLWDRVRRVLDQPLDLLVCDLSAVDEADAVLLDAVARIQLLARRAGCQVRIDRASSAVTGLFELAGLKDSAVFEL